ncbi:hypothetical protein E4V51_31150, partial [Paenibacillus sp. 28ISP30-2]|nr:hypothetical protein [Paenibacillus sp. 28ISP30-2]
MGRIVKKVTPVAEMINNNINQFVQSSTEDYAVFQDKAPVFVTYYSRHAYASTFDKNFEAHNEVVGQESPNKFNKIENLPVYDLEISDFTQDETATGRISEVNSSSVILQDTVIPMDEEQILLVHQSKKYLFTVTNITPDNYNNKKYYKFYIKLSSYTVDNIERQVD